MNTDKSARHVLLAGIAASLAVATLMLAWVFGDQGSSALLYATVIALSAMLVSVIWLHRRRQGK